MYNRREVQGYVASWLHGDNKLGTQDRFYFLGIFSLFSKVIWR